MKKDDLFFHLPELKFPCDELREWGNRNKDKFRNSGEWVDGLFGCMIPYSFTDILNDQVKLDISLYNAGMPVFRRGQIYILTEEYAMHTDPRRDSSLNFVLSGDAVTMWDNAIVCEYLPNVATLFNTQVPHAIFPKGDVPRMAVSFCVSMSYQRFVNLHKRDLMFTAKDSMMHISEIII